jgi:glycosyltransferase involved in cell wall biosynthesis
MKVSVLVPVCNSETFLSECLESVLAQDFEDMEILIVDDASTDGSLALVERYAARDSRIKWWKNPGNLGLPGNHNACLRRARGEYVKFIHADDKLLSTSAIRHMAAALDENPSAVLVGCQQHLTGVKSRPTILSQKSGVYDGRQMIVASLENNTNLIGQPTLTLFRRSAARRGFDDRFVGHLDFEMWCHLLEQGDFFYLAETLATWRVHETQQTARNMTNGSSHHEHLLLMKNYFAKPWLKDAATSQMLFAQVYYLEKKYGRQADHLITAMMAQLSSRHFAWQWLKHKGSRPIQKILRRCGFPLNLALCRCQSREMKPASSNRRLAQDL